MKDGGRGGIKQNRRDVVQGGCYYKKVRSIKRKTGRIRCQDGF